MSLPSSRDLDLDTMDIENRDPSLEDEVSPGFALLPPGISTIGCVTSYQQMVSSLMIRRHSEARSIRAAKKSGEKRKTRSKLVDCI